MIAPRIRPLLASDRARVEEILRATGAFSEDEISVALELVDDATAPSPSGDYAAIGVLATDGALAGYACHGATPGTRGTHDLYWIATDPALHGAGYGRALLDAVERALASDGGRLLVAETSTRDDYAATRTFYLRSGFVEAATIADFYAPGDGRALFTRRVASGRGARERRTTMYDTTHGEADGTTADGIEAGGSSTSTPTRAPDGRGTAAR